MSPWFWGRTAVGSGRPRSTAKGPAGACSLAYDCRNRQPRAVVNGGDMGIENLINSANAGQLALHIDDEAFNELIKACDTYIDSLRELHDDATNLSYHPLGFSEDHLESGAQLAKKFQDKAGAPDNSAAATFKSHIERVEEFKSLFVAARKAYQQTEEHNTRAFKPGDGH